MHQHRSAYGVGRAKATRSVCRNVLVRVMKAIRVKLDPSSVMSQLPALPCVIAAADQGTLIYVYGEADLVARCHAKLIEKVGGDLIEAGDPVPAFAITTQGNVKSVDLTKPELFTVTEETAQWILDPIAAYKANGIRPIPLHKGTKKPRLDGWEKEEQADKINADDNIGGALDDITDIDCDWQRASLFARLLLPQTKSFGRSGKPYSHLLYNSVIEFEQFKSPRKVSGEKDMVIEIRRGANKQTMLPPSIHDSGEQVAFETAFPIAEIDPKELRRLVGIVAFVTVIDGLWGGARHDSLLALAGVLRRASVDKARMIAIKNAIFALHGDDPKDKADRDRIIDDTYNKDVKKVASWTKLATEFGLSKDEVAVFKKWLYPGTIVHVSEEVLAFVERYAAITLEGRVAVIDMTARRFETINRDDFFALHDNKPSMDPITRRMSSVGRVWWKDPDRLTFNGVVIEDPATYRGEGYNYFRDFDVQPREGDVGPFIELTEFIAGGIKEHRDWMLDFLADMVQRPTEPSPHVGIIMFGPQGQGKSLWMKFIYKMCGPDLGMWVPRSKSFLGEFNRAAYGKVAICCEEAPFAGSGQLAAELKTFIAGDDYEYAQKFAPAFTGKNVSRFFSTSNHDHAANIDNDDRRYYLPQIEKRFDLETEDGKAKAWEHFTPHYRLLKGDGPAHLLHFLKERKYKDETLMVAPITQGKRDNKLRSNPVLEWLDEVAENGVLPHDIHGEGKVSSKAACEVINRALVGHKKVTPESLAADLKKLIKPGKARNTNFIVTQSQVPDAKNGGSKTMFKTEPARGFDFGPLPAFREKMHKITNRDYPKGDKHWGRFIYQWVEGDGDRPDIDVDVPF